MVEMEDAVGSQWDEEPVGFADCMVMDCEKKRGFKDDFRTFA